jgi:hypothetical protein
MVVNMTEGLYPDFVGRRQIFAGSGAGPTSYTTGGDPVTLSNPRLYIDALQGGVATTDGAFWVVAVPSAAGPRQTWKFIWYTIGTFNQPTAGQNLSTHTLDVAGFCGQF